MSLYPELPTFPLLCPRNLKQPSESIHHPPFTAENTEAERGSHLPADTESELGGSQLEPGPFLGHTAPVTVPPGWRQRQHPPSALPFFPLCKALVSRKLYINHHFLPALARFVCGWDTVCVWGRLGSGLVFQLIQCLFNTYFLSPPGAQGQKRAMLGPRRESEPALPSQDSWSRREKTSAPESPQYPITHALMRW